MHRRRLLETSSVVFGAALGTRSAATAVAQDDVDDGSAEPDPIEFVGEGVTVTDEFEIEGGPTLVDASHEGESTFYVRAVPKGDGADYSLITHTGEFDGSTGSFVEDGTYVLYVDADGPWELLVRQPRVSESSAEEPPISIEGTGADWIGPILFDGDTRVAGTYDDDSIFRVEIVPQEADDNEFVWGGGELVFETIGAFGGVTAVHTNGVGYVTVEADGEWALEIE